MILRLCTLLLAAASSAMAAMSVKSPDGSASIAAGSVPLEIEGFTTGSTVTVQVMVGGTTDQLSAQVYSPGVVPYSGTATTFTGIPATAPNVNYAAYYLRITVTPTGGAAASVLYSNRFVLTGVTGTVFPGGTAVQNAAQQAAQQGDTAVPPAIGGGNAAAASSGQANMVAFSLQTGTIKTAPMQQKPAKTITQANTAPLYPTSAWSIFTTLAPIPSQISTITPSATYSASSKENTATAQAMPSDDMAKYLRRWVD